MGTLVMKHQTRTNLGVPLLQGIRWLARERGRQPAYLESRSLDPSHPRKPSPCLAQAEAPSSQLARDPEPHLGHLPTPGSIHGATRSPGAGLEALAVTARLVKGEAPHVQQGTPRVPVARMAQGLERLIREEPHATISVSLG